MTIIAFLPTLNAFLNFTTFVLLVLGFLAIKKRNIPAHKTLMVLAFMCSCLFLCSYLVYHFNVLSKKYEGTGALRVVYFSILLSHTILAVVMLPLILKTFYRAWKNDVEGHRKVAKITWPIWIYVSVTGVVIYAFLYL